MALGKNLSGMLGVVVAIVVSSFVIGLIFSTAVLGEENTMTLWKTDTLCSYTANSNVSPENSGCVKLSNVIFVYSSKNFVFVATKDAEFGGVSLYVIDTNYENLIDNNFIYDKTLTKIVKYKNVISVSGGSLTTLCADGKNFAYGASSSHIVTYNGETNLKTGNKILGGSPLSCELNGENLAVCTTSKIYVLDRQGNIRWSQDVDGCKKVKILNNKVFVASSNKFLVFSIDGSVIFSKDISVRDMDGTDKIAVAISDGIYTYEENLNNLNKLVNDTAVIRIAGLNKAIAYVTPSTLRVVNYNKNIVSEYAMKPNTHLISIIGNKNHGVASTDVADPDTITIDVTDISHYAGTKAEDMSGKIKSLYIKDEMLISLLPDNRIGFKNFVGISAQEAITGGENILSEITNMGATSAEKKQINDAVNKMKDAFEKRNYADVMETAKSLLTQAATAGNSYTLQEKYLTDNLLEMSSEKGMLLTTGIKLRYDNAIEKRLAGNYKGAIDDFRGVRTETEQYVRDKTLVLLKDVEQRKSAIEKFAESTENITELDDEINSEKDYVNAFTLLEDVKELEDMTKEKTIELFENAEKVKKEAETPWLIFGADVRDIEDKIQEAHIAEDENDYEKTIKTLSEATKEAKDYDVISKAQDVCVIAIIVGIIVLIILFMRRPKIKSE